MPQKEEQHFIREKIKDKPLNKKKILQKGIAVAGYAIVFGVVSCLVFCWLKPVIEPWFDTGSNEWLELPIHTTADDVPPDTKTDNEQGAKTEDTEKQPKEEEEREQKTVYITEQQKMTLDDYQILQNQLYLIGSRVNKSIVTVTGLREGTDIFDSPYEAVGQSSGLIFAENSKELLVLTEYEVIQDVKSIHVKFINNEELDAELKKYDINTGIAVLGIAKRRIAKATMDQIEIAVFGDSRNLRQGRMVVALGSPLGTNYSILTGNITSVSNTIATTDWNYTVFTTNIIANESGSGVLANTDGEVIGLFLQSTGFQKEQNTLTAVSISELKEIIEMLSNGRNIPYIGIQGSTVTDSISEEYDIPKGVYIKEVAAESPAMNAGLQNGDVVVAMDGDKISTMEDYQQKLLALKKGNKVKIIVSRQWPDTYKKYTCKVEVGVLK